MWTLILDWATAITAVLAFFRPDLTRLYNKWFRPPSVDIFESGLIEVGFSQLGPVVNLFGSLRAVHADAFITRMSLKVIRWDGLAVNLDWAFFRWSDFAAASTSFVMCSAFLLPEKSSQTYNVAFIDRDTQDKLQDITHKLQKAWEAFGHKPIEKGGTEAEIAARLEKFRELVRSGKTYMGAYTKIGDLIPWKAGRYKLELIVSTSRPDKQHPKRWSFDITEDQAEYLRVNQALVVESVIAPVANFRFTSTEYDS